ncbi:MAG: ATP-binding protein [Phycisphaerales bacterium]|nr:ATP-binding protein [Phycisphaerales bacterium]
MAEKPAKRSAHSVAVHYVRDELESLQAELAQNISSAGYSEAAAFSIRLALEEAVINAHKHGNHGDTSKIVAVSWSVTADEVVIEVSDGGGGFDPHSVPDPTSDENLEIPSGRGIMLMRAYMGDVTFVAPGNRVRMVYRKPSE